MTIPGSNDNNFYRIDLNGYTLTYAGDLDIDILPWINGGAVDLTGNLSVYSELILDETSVLQLPGDLYVSSALTNGSTIYVAGDLTAGDVQSDGQITVAGDMSISGRVELSVGKVVVEGDVGVTDQLIFNHGTMEVGGNIEFNYGDISMTNEDDYLLVHGDYNTYRSNSTLTAGTTEIKGDFYSKSYQYDDYPNYNETETHKTIFSGTETQTIIAYYPSETNRFTNLYLENEDINFATPIYQLILNQDINLDDTELLTVKNLLDLNGYTLTVYDDVSYGTLEENGGKLIIVCTHKSISSVTAADPDCVTDGNIAHWACTKCGACFGDENGTQPLTAEEVAIPALGHTTEMQNAADATCTKGGYTGDLVCSVCGETAAYGEEVPATGHTSVTDAAVAATCTATGLTVGSHCSVCDEVIVAQTVTDALGHTEVVDAAVAATCTSTGLTEGSHCSVCDEVLVAQTVIAKLSHAYETTVIAPSCEEGGYTKHVCSTCGDSYTSDETEATGHNWDDGVITKEPTEDADGVKTYTCSSCGETRTESIVSQPQTGDVNADGEMDLVDVVVLMKWLVSNQSEEELKSGDVNEDGSIDILDVIRLIRILSGDLTIKAEATMLQSAPEQVDEADEPEEMPEPEATVEEPAETEPEAETTTEEPVETESEAEVGFIIDEFLDENLLQLFGDSE